MAVGSVTMATGDEKYTDLHSFQQLNLLSLCTYVYKGAGAKYTSWYCLHMCKPAYYKKWFYLLPRVWTIQYLAMNAVANIIK